MAPSSRVSSLIPPGFVVESVERTEHAIHVVAHAESEDAVCPMCGAISRRVHSHYVRQVCDLPCAGCTVGLTIVTRRFFCTAPACPRRIFAERFEDGAVRERARRTERLDCIVHHLGLALGGRPGASFAQRLMLPVSNDTLLRLVRRRAYRQISAPTVIGIDDWAWKRGQRYGTLICDLERRKTIDLLPDRQPATLDAWLGAHPSIRVISRDRGGGYGQAAARACPNALQVADRWHLMENASAAFLAAVRRSMPAIWRRTQGQPIDRALLTQAERIQHDGFLLRQKANARIDALARDGLGGPRYTGPLMRS